MKPRRSPSQHEELKCIAKATRTILYGRHQLYVKVYYISTISFIRLALGDRALSRGVVTTGVFFRPLYLQ